MIRHSFFGGTRQYSNARVSCLENLPTADSAYAAILSHSSEKRTPDHRLPGNQPKWSKILGVQDIQGKITVTALTQVHIRGGSLRASSYEPGNWAGSVGGTNFAFCSHGKFQLRNCSYIKCQLSYRDEQNVTFQISSR